MNNKATWLRMITSVLILFLLTCAAPILAIESADQPSPGSIWIDQFESPTLHGRWTWIRENPPHWSLTTNPGSLRIITQSGSLYTNSVHNLLLTEAPSTDYRITTRVTISPSENFQGAGLVVYQDDDNYTRLSRRHANGNQEINFRQEINGVLHDGGIVIDSATTVYLRMTKTGNVYRGDFSTDGINYTDVGELEMAATSPQIGLASENGPSETEIPSDYDFFQLGITVYQVCLPLVQR